MVSKKNFYAVVLDEEKCKGCINCMKKCPTEAIRVRDGKAHILYDKCIGCGECVRTCTYRAKLAVYDDFDIINNFKYKVALPAPSLYGQFNNLDNIDYVLNGLKRIGFDDVYEVARGAEIVSQLTRDKFEKGDVKKPVISSACPAVKELILMRFHSLKDNLLDIKPPVEVAAMLAKEKAIKETGLKSEEIGVFFISPCPAKVYELKKESKNNEVDGILSAGEVYFKLLAELKEIEDLDSLLQSGIIGIGWASSGGEASGVLKEKRLSADGVENCMSVLKELENGNLTNLDFIELNACPGGCVGGVLNVENPFVAKAKLHFLKKYRPVSMNTLENIDTSFKEEDFYLKEKPKVIDSLKLDEDFSTALIKVKKLEELLSLLPMVDCGACGAPSCEAFAEDVIMGYAKASRCKRIKKRFKMKVKK